MSHTEKANIELIREKLNRLEQMHTLEGLDEEKIKKFTTLIKDTYNIAVNDGLKYAMYLMDYDTFNTVVITDERFGTDAKFILDVDRMIINDSDATRKNIKGHTSLERFKTWLNYREDFGMMAIKIETNMYLRNGTIVDFPQYPFKATPDSYFINDAKDSIFTVDEFVHIHADAPMGRDITNGDEHVLHLDNGYLVNYRQNTLAHNICEGLAELSNLRIEEYKQFVNFITDELPELRKDKAHARLGAVMDDMMGAFCSLHLRTSKEPDLSEGIIKVFCNLMEIDNTPSVLTDVASDMMVIGHAGIFKRIWHIIQHNGVKTVDEFEELLKNYHSLSLADTGYISTFINMPSDLIGACIRKYFGGTELHEYRDYYRTLVWGE